MSALWYILMVAGLIGMIWCAKSQKRAANAKLYAIICLVVVVISAIMALVNYFGPDEETERAMANQQQFELSKLNKIAEYINQNFAGKKVAILVHQDQLPSKDSTYIRVDPVKELKSFLKDVTVLDPVIIKNPTPEEIKAMGGSEDTMPDEISRSPESFNKMFEECKTLQPDVIVDLAGLPSGDGRKLKVWRWKGKNVPKLILAQVDDIGSGFRPEILLDSDGVLEGFIVGRNDVKFNHLQDKAPKELNEAFDVLYVFVTKSNFKQLVKDKTITVYDMK